MAETLDDFRSGLTCKICFRILYEPYTTQCGHTFCYSCLSQWFTDNNNVHKKTCPDCRAAVKNSPAPAYLVRDLAQKFVQQIHLFGDEEETLEQHLQLQQEEAAIVERDRASMRGLFKGRFKNRTINLRPIIHDAEDQVDRCPSCAWELEGERICHRCGAEVGSGSDSEEEEDESSEEHWHSGAVIDLDTDEDLDGEVDMEDADVEGDFDSPETGARRPSISARRFTNARRVLNSELSPRTRRGRDSRIPDDEYSDPESAANTSRSASSVQEEDGDQISTDDDEDADDDDDDDDGDSTMNDFVVDDEQETDEADDSESSGSTPRQTPTRTATRTKGLRRSHPFVIPSDDDSSESNSSPESDEDPDDDVVINNRNSRRSAFLKSSTAIHIRRSHLN